jgi:hypothetical protein
MALTWDHVLKRAAGTLKWIIADFGALLIFLALSLTLGSKAAIAGSLLFLLGDAARRLHAGIAFNKLYVLTSVLAVTLGVIDLLSPVPFILKYEPAFSSAATGLVFLAGARGPKSMIQELAERRRGAPFVERPDLARFFQIITLVWAAFFAARAVFYVLIAEEMSLSHVLIVRSAIGTGSLALMILLSLTQARRFYALCQRMGLLPARPSDHD